MDQASMDEYQLMKETKWETRRSRRWGSEYIESFVTKEAAISDAESDIIRNGNLGKITYIDQERQVIYYSIYPEEN